LVQVYAEVTENGFNITIVNWNHPYIL
jgi:hypothetical protein